MREKCPDTRSKPDHLYAGTQPWLALLLIDKKKVTDCKNNVRRMDLAKNI